MMDNPLKKSLPIVLLSGYFLFVHISRIYIINIVLSVLLFYPYFGYLVLTFILNRYKKTDKNEKTIHLTIIQIVGFSFLIGIILNVLYGVVAIIFNIYTIQWAYFGYYGIIALLYLSLNSSEKENETILNFRKNDLYALLAIFIPIMIQIFLYFNYSPFPYFMGWDIMRYQGITNEFLFGLRRYVILFEGLNSSGFNFIQANIVHSSNLPLYYLIEFDKLGVIFSNGMCTIWVFLICYKITKSHLFSIISSMLLALYNGGIALGPYHFLPSSLAWNIGLSLFYVILLNLEKFDIKFFKEKILKTRNKNELLFGAFILLLIFILFSFHIFTALVVLIILILFLFQCNYNFKGVIFSIIIFEIFLIISSQISSLSFITEIFSNIVNVIINDSSISIWSFLETFDYLFLSNNTIISPVYGLVFSISLLIFSKNKQHKMIALNFLLLLLLFFIPLRAIYRIAYIIYFYNVILISIFYQKLHAFLIFIHSKMDKNSSIYKKVEILSLKYSKLNLSHVIFAIWLSFSILPIFNATIESYPHSSGFIIENSITGDINYSSYSYDEFSAAQWLNHNVDNPNDTNLCADPGSNRFLYGLSGVHIIESYKIDIDGYRSIFQNCNEEGLNITFFQDFTTLKNKSLLLVITPRMHKWIQTGSEEERTAGENSWINGTLLEYIGDSNNFTRVYNNTGVYVFLFLPNE